MNLQATAIGLPLWRGLAGDRRRGRVHSVFRRTVNVLCDDTTWLSIHPESVPMHPYAVRVEASEAGHIGIPASGKAFLGASRAELVTVGTDCVRFEGRSLSIDLDAARVWDAGLRPFGTGLDAGRMLSTLKDVIGPGPAVSPFLASMLGRPQADGDAWTAALYAAATGIIARVKTGLKAGSVETLRSGLRQAIGLGPGLTPSGDDFITGLLGALHCFGAPEALRESVAASVRPLLGRTSLPSAMMVEAAGRGLYPEALVGLLVSLGHAPAADLSGAMGMLISTGAASGEDMLAGIMTYLESAAPGSHAHATH
jgi:hypothetical protein